MMIFDLGMVLVGETRALQARDADGRDEAGQKNAQLCFDKTTKTLGHVFTQCECNLDRMVDAWMLEIGSVVGLVGCPSQRG